MEVIKSGSFLEYEWPFLTGTALAKGAAVTRGATGGTDTGLLITGASALVDCMGIAKEAIAAADGANVAGTQWLTNTFAIPAPINVIRCEYLQTDTMAVASTSTTTVTITSLEDNIDTGYLYATSGTGSGLLAYLAASAAGSATSKTATGWDSTTTVIKILPLFHPLAKIATGAATIGTDAAAGSWTVTVLQNWIQVDGSLEILKPTLHDNINYTGRTVKFWCDLVIRNTGFYPVD